MVKMLNWCTSSSWREVVAEVVAQGRGDKVKIVKFRRRKHSRKQQGHRQCSQK